MFCLVDALTVQGSSISSMELVDTKILLTISIHHWPCRQRSRLLQHNVSFDCRGPWHFATVISREIAHFTVEMYMYKTRTPAFCQVHKLTTHKYCACTCQSQLSVLKNIYITVIDTVVIFWSFWHMLYAKQCFIRISCPSLFSYFSNNMWQD